jgi:glycerol-3-phosphate dehydrogenase
VAHWSESEHRGVDAGAAIDVAVDVAVVGGGIAGLWLLNRLLRHGYSALLIEADTLGSGQTLHAQGIIHGGTKYALSGRLSSAAQAVAAMPRRWRCCLRGEGEIDLRRVRVLSDYHYLLSTAAPGSRLSGFFASKAMHSRVQQLARANYPPGLTEAGSAVAVYRLDEPVVDVASLLYCLAQPVQSVLLRGTVREFLPQRQQLEVRTSADERFYVGARRIVFSAGAGNAALSDVPMQRRALHMVLARAGQLPRLYIHGLGMSDTPRITITSHPAPAGHTVWYLGGQLAEAGVERDAMQQIDCARDELSRLLPWIDLTGVQFSTLRIDRAEARRRHGKRPDTPVLIDQPPVITAWPTKLALAPLLADQVLALLQRQSFEPRLPPPCLPPQRDLPQVAACPWQQPRRWI